MKFFGGCGCVGGCPFVRTINKFKYMEYFINNNNKKRANNFIFTFSVNSLKES